MDESGNKLVLAVIGIIALLYVVSPVDLLPGPLDDAILIICGLSAMLRH